LFNLNHPKIKLAQEIKEKEKQIANNSNVFDRVILNSFIMAITDFNEACQNFGGITREEFNKLNILFIDEFSLKKHKTKPVKKLFEAIFAKA